MKKVITTIGLVVCFLNIVSAQNEVTIENPNAPEISFETEVIDYGDIEQDADGVREFKFTNTGKEPLIISNATGSCGCTVPTWPKEPIKPGESSVIKVKYDTHRIGPINKSVTLTSNAKTATKTLRIKGNVHGKDAAAPAEGDQAAPAKTSGS